jgi:hypothetical protein
VSVEGIEPTMRWCLNPGIVSTNLKDQKRYPEIPNIAFYFFKAASFMNRLFGQAILIQ